MLKNTFLHVPSVGYKTEKKLWEREIFSWSRFLEKSKIPGFSKRSLARTNEYLFNSMEALKKKDINFFAKNLPSREWWRLYPEFNDHVAFLDIETTGLSRYYDDVTLIGLFDGKKMNIYIQRQNLDDFFDEIRKYSIIVTYNGTLFDLPFLVSKFELLELPPVHIDLRFFLRRLGYKGGLKLIEERFGIVREKEIQEIDGFGAAVLWNRYLRGSADALELLVKYNVADTTNLKTLMDIGCRMMREKLLRNREPSRRDISAKTLKFGVHVGRIDDWNLNFVVGKNSPLPIDLKLNETGRIEISMLLSKFKEPEKYPKVVGIDLSGSEKRKTGWAILQGRFVETKTLKTDKEIIDLTVNAKPDLISIDSPLSLPKGRDCTKDSCECRKFGITRECERILRKRGIFIFPSLIRSMQPLTERGVRLRQEFEKFGFQVIESYPGATQDILRIIRKKINVEELKQGLLDFGLTGDFETRRAIHDELDAVTSALVGYFYLADSFEAIGNSEEGYLIIPNPHEKLNRAPKF